MKKSQLLLFSQVAVPVLALSCCCCLDSAAAAAKTAAPMGLDLALEAEPNPDNALDIKEEVVVEEELAAEDTAAAVVVLLAAVELVAVAAAAAEAVNYTREYGLLILAHQINTGVESKLSLESLPSCNKTYLFSRGSNYQRPELSNFLRVMHFGDNSKNWF